MGERVYAAAAAMYVEGGGGGGNSQCVRARAEVVAILQASKPLASQPASYHAPSKPPDRPTLDKNKKQFGGGGGGKGSCCCRIEKTNEIGVEGEKVCRMD